MVTFTFMFVLFHGNNTITVGYICYRGREPMVVMNAVNWKASAPSGQDLGAVRPLDRVGLYSGGGPLT